MWQLCLDLCQKTDQYADADEWEANKVDESTSCSEVDTRRLIVTSQPSIVALNY